MFGESAFEEELEELLDKVGLRAVVIALASYCGENAASLRGGSPRDRDAAKIYQAVQRLLNKVGDATVGL